MKDFEKNRKKLDDATAANSVSVFFSGEAPVKVGDEFYPFLVDKNFYYLTGIQEENCIFFMGKNLYITYTTLYIPRENGELAKWIGKNITKEEAKYISGVDDVKYIDEFENDISTFIWKNQIATIYVDLQHRKLYAPRTKAMQFINDFRKDYPSIWAENSYPIMASFRVIKEEGEIAWIEKAVEITEQAFLSMMEHMKPDMYEYEIEAYFDFVLKKSGVKEKAFQTIVAGGERACVLHYMDNENQVKENELVLIDAGATFGGYSGDITRTIPISGTFTERQKEVYNIVLDGQRKVIEAIRPDVLFTDLNEILKQHYFEALSKIGLVETMEDVSKYYYHGVSHYLGAETHDVGMTIGQPLEKNMVLTVEPGLYIEEWGIGIRIEDDVVVTESGCRVLTKYLPKTVEEIETFFKNRV